MRTLHPDAPFGCALHSDRRFCDADTGEAMLLAHANFWAKNTRFHNKFSARTGPVNAVRDLLKAGRRRKAKILRLTGVKKSMTYVLGKHQNAAQSNANVRARFIAQAQNATDKEKVPEIKAKMLEQDERRGSMLLTRWTAMSARVAECHSRIRKIMPTHRAELDIPEWVDDYDYGVLARPPVSHFLGGETPIADLLRWRAPPEPVPDDKVLLLK
jgi:hypothetical protein